MKSNLLHILIVDDDARLRKLIKRYLDDNDFVTVTAETAAKAREILQHLKFDLIVLDVMMPSETGREFLNKLRKTSQMPVLMLTAQGETSDRITGLEAGADDYLTKPFEPKELVLRIKSILKRQPKMGIRFGGYDFDPNTGVLKNAEKNIHLTSAEELLLKNLATNVALTREELAELLKLDSPRAVDVQITRLRKKIEHDPKKPVYIVTVRGSGYKLNV